MRALRHNPRTKHRLRKHKTQICTGRTGKASALFLPGALRQGTLAQYFCRVAHHDIGRCKHF